MLDLYCIEGTDNICDREVDGPEYNTPETWPAFQEDWAILKNEIVKYVKNNKPRVYLRIFDGEFWFLQGQKVGNVGRRHCSRDLTPEFLKKFYDGFLNADVVSTQLYAHEITKYSSLFPQRPFDIPMELIYSLVSSRWIFKQFPSEIALIGGNEKMSVIQELMKHAEYRKYIGVEKFTDYISVPERFSCDDTDAVFDSMKEAIKHSKAKIFLFGMGIAKLAIAHRFKEISNAVFIDVGCGISALAGTTSVERPYFGSWINYRLLNWNYGNMDEIDFRDTANINVRYL